MDKQLYVQTGKAGAPMCTVAVESIEKPMRHHKLGLSWTRSGYGKEVPTVHMVRFEGKWRRVYCTVYSNSGRCWIWHGSEQLTVSEG
jgi:hypothetical protein